MNAILPFKHIQTRHKYLVGGKALALASLMRSGIAVPDGLCITTTAYRDYICKTGLDTRIALEMGRLPLAKMRWEEIWDMALRIRNLFLTTDIPNLLKAELIPMLNTRFSDCSVAVRSSSPQEDQADTSFAGLHESYVNIRGTEAILEHIRLVWASLWSDGALLYRKELGMDMHNSRMAVIVQELVSGECSGVAFSMSPHGGDQAVVESVYGLNQGLVDGSIAPDRWTIDRQSGTILDHTPAVREYALQPTIEGVGQRPLHGYEKRNPPLNNDQLERVFRLAMDLEKREKHPQDVEWTCRQNVLFLLQTRPVTTTTDGPNETAPWSADDKRPWYQSLKRSFDNLKVLHRRIEDELLPQMAAEADQLATYDLAAFSDEDLAKIIETRIGIHQHWVDVYWREFIPFAHGARLFGQVYNDVVKPDDPYAFTALLGETRMTGLARNRDLQGLADMIRSNDRLQKQLTAGWTDDQFPEFTKQLDGFLSQYGDLTFKAVRFFSDREGLIRLLVEMATRTGPTAEHRHPDMAAMSADFIARFPENRRDYARQLLEIGRASYQLRDNDNIVLARIEAQLIKAVDEAKRRIGDRRQLINLDGLSPQQAVQLLQNPSAAAQIEVQQATIDEPVQHQLRPNLTPQSGATTDGKFVMRARQIIGQPAGQGLAVGKARVISAVVDLFQFKSGEVLVCDSIDPNMTFVVPLAAAIVERRGGMLVHGAIIAREYGLPCVTGVDDATAMIHTGDRVTVDGYLGIVTIDT